VGSAGIGVVDAASKTMARMLGNTESAYQSARSQFWVVDASVFPFLSQNFIDSEFLDMPCVL
jgi:malate dehydrogenase (decarboxylating)